MGEKAVSRGGGVFWGFGFKNKRWAFSFWLEGDRPPRARRGAPPGEGGGGGGVFQTPNNQPLKGGFGFSRCLPLGPPPFWVPNSRSIEFLRRHMSSGTLIDVGANVGLVSILLADKLDHAWLFEPNSAAAARARENLALNQLEFGVYSLALSERTGAIEFEDRGGVNATNRTDWVRNSPSNRGVFQLLTILCRRAYLAGHSRSMSKDTRNSVLLGMQPVPTESAPTPCDVRVSGADSSSACLDTREGLATL